MYFHVCGHVYIKIDYFTASSLFCSHSLRRTRSERARRRLNCLFVWTVSNKKPEDFSAETKQAFLDKVTVSSGHLSPTCFFFGSFHRNVMLVDEVVVPELRFVALFTKCLTFGMLL